MQKYTICLNCILIFTADERKLRATKLSWRFRSGRRRFQIFETQNDFAILYSNVHYFQSIFKLYV